MAPLLRLELRLLGLAEVAHAELREPVRRQLTHQLREGLLDALEVSGEGAIEAVVMTLVLHQAGARDVIEALGARLRETARQRLEQRQQLGDRNRDAGAAQQEEELDEHGRRAAAAGV